MKFYSLKAGKESGKKQVFSVKKIEERELKETYARNLYKGKSDEFINEVISSEFWALLSEGECYGLFTVVEKDDRIAEISHFSTYITMLKTHITLLVLFYIEIEKYYIKKNHEVIKARMPDIEEYRPIHKFFRKIKFDTVIEYHGREERYIYLIKTNLKEYYTEKDGDLVPNITYKNK